MRILIIFILILIPFVGDIVAKTYFVSPEGLDTNTGSLEKPFKSFDRAVAAIEVSGASDTIFFRGGYYFFSKTVVLNNNNCSEEVTFKAYENEKPIFTSGVQISGWEKINATDAGYKYLPQEAKPNVYVAPLPKDLKLVRHLVDYQSNWLELAKINVTDYITTKKFVHGNSVEGQMWDPPAEKKICTFSKSFEGLSNQDDALLFSIYTADFELQMLPVESIFNNTLTTSTPGGHRLALPEKGQRHGSKDLAFIHNLLEGIDKEGKWACYPEYGKIYLWPVKGTEQIYAPVLNELIKIEGVPSGREAWFSTTQEKPVKNIVFEGITFSNCEQPVWLTGDVTAQHDWALLDKDNALLRFRGAEDCLIKNCTFRKSGGAGIAFDLYAQKNRVENSLFEYLGFEALRFAGYGIGQKDENHHNIVRDNEIHHVNINFQYGAAIVIWNSGFNQIENNYIHHFASRAVLLSAPRSRAFTKNNQPLFPADRVMREQAWPMARWFEVPDEALALVKMTSRNVRHEQVKGNKDGKPMDIQGDAIPARFRYLRGNIVSRNVIANGAEELFADAIFYVTACASGEANKIMENYIFNTGIGLPDANIPFRLLYVDGFSGPFIFTCNIAYNSRFKFEAVAPYSWWGEVSNTANLFYNVRAAEDEYFGGRGVNNGNVCVGYGPNNPKKEYLEDYARMLELLKSNELPGPKPLPGITEIIARLETVMGTLKKN